MYIPKYYSVWHNVQEDWVFKNFISLDLTNKLIHNLFSSKLDSGLCGHTVYRGLCGHTVYSGLFGHTVYNLDR